MPGPETEKPKPRQRKKPVEKPDDADLLGDIGLKTTADVEVPQLLIEQVIGQDHGVEVVRKAASQRRHVMMIGTPGTGKSMLAQAMAELLPKEELQDVLVYHNPEDANMPKVRVVPAGKGKQIIGAHRQELAGRMQVRNFLMIFLAMGIIMYTLIFAPEYFLFGIIAAILLIIAFRYITPKSATTAPKLLVNNAGRELAPFMDGTGAHAGALLGDVRHDPFQSGGLETPSHDRVEAGAIHKGHKGVLFIDEINTLRIESQQSLLTAIQEGEFSITGQSERSSGAMVKTEPVPCDFIMVSAGNLDALGGMHPALRSRIKGYGYELYMQETMADNIENRQKLVRFIAQEVQKDGKIPHFTREAVNEIVREARRRAGRKGHLTLILRDLGGLVRVAGDIAHAEGAKETTEDHVFRAKKLSRSVEQQLADYYLERRRDYQMFHTDGAEVGRVNGLAIIGHDSGIVLPILAEITPSLSKSEGRIIATGQLRKIAKEAVENVSALFKKMPGNDITSHDIHIQFMGTYDGVEGDSASVSVATAVISAMEGIPIDQSVAMTGSLSVQGEVLPVGGVTYKIEAAANAGIKTVLIPSANKGDVLLEDSYKDKIKVIAVSTVQEVLKYSLKGPKKDAIVDKFQGVIREPSKQLKATTKPVE